MRCAGLQLQAAAAHSGQSRRRWVRRARERSAATAKQGSGTSNSFEVGAPQERAHKPLARASVSRELVVRPSQPAYAPNPTRCCADTHAGKFEERHVDQVWEDVRKPAQEVHDGRSGPLGTTAKAELDADLPGHGQHYCIPCACVCGVPPSRLSRVTPLLPWLPALLCLQLIDNAAAVSSQRDSLMANTGPRHSSSLLCCLQTLLPECCCTRGP